MPEATPSLAPEAPTQEVTPAQVRARLAEPAPETAVEEETAPEPQTEESGEEPPDEPEQPELALPDKWEEAEPVVERLKAAESDGYNKAKSHLTRAHNATLSELEETHQEEVRQAQQ